MKKRGHFIIKGYVQGVCFRMYARNQAEQLGVTGWVRNQSDGNVEIVAEGEKDALSKLLAWCRQGPSYADVTGIDVKYSEATGEFSSFEIKS